MKTIGNTPIEFLTKRELFAAMAMQGMLANNQVTSVDDTYDGAYTVTVAIYFADKLIKELNEKPESDEGNEV